jgi:hypothetical protein
MNLRRQILTLAAAGAVTAALALPALAPAEYYVPPANSAANQYTESFPGAGGESGGKRKDVTPGAALGAGNAKQLEKKGKAGKEAAEVAAETAPAQLAGDGGASGGDGGGKAGNTGKSGGGASGGGDGEEEGGSGATGTGTGTGTAGGSGGGSRGGTGDGANSVKQPQGSSGFGQVLGQATGTDDGNLGLWLPLAIVLTLIGSVAYWVRMRHAQAGHRA